MLVIQIVHFPPRISWSFPWGRNRVCTKQSGSYNSKLKLCRVAWKPKRMRYNCTFIFYSEQHWCFFLLCIRYAWAQLDPPGQVQKLQSIIASRASQYSHDAKRKEREAAKLKERLSQLLVDRKDKKLGKCPIVKRPNVFCKSAKKFIDFWAPMSPI